MQVNSLNNLTYTAPRIGNFKPYRAFTGNVSFSGKDTFERRNIDKNEGINKTESASLNEWSDEKLRAVYNEAYDEVMAQNPISEELNIKMPKIKMMEHTSSDGIKTFAGYSFQTNEMIVLPGAKGALYLCIAIKKDTGEKISLGICDKATAKENDEIAQKYGYNTNVTKLNDKEKEAYLKTVFAHELRHCIQMHLIASTRECSRPFKKSIVREFQKQQANYTATYKKLEELNDQAEALGLEREEITIQPPDIEYADNFIPKKVIDDDAKLKFSLSQNDRRYLSTKDHLLNGYFLQISKDNAKEEYSASPLEMDANNYAYQYFCTKLKKNPEYQDIRPIVSNEIQDFCYNRAKQGISTMGKFGFPDLIKK